jgi:hypothetical protein
MATVFVTKFDGTRQSYEREKVIRTCIKLHATKELAENAADKVESRLYNGIPTREILRMIYRYLAEDRPQTKYELDLRHAICLLRSKPDFEQYVSRLLATCGYNVVGPQIIRGRCVEHEIDDVARKDNETVYVEVKHHSFPHTFTGLDIFLQARATFEDLVNGYEAGYNKIPFNKPMVICNTKLSDHAKRYASCAQIDHISWQSPQENSLEKLIEEKQLYPVTVMKALDSETQAKLGDAGIILLQELIESDPAKLSEMTKIPKDKIKKLIQRAAEIAK